MQYLNVILLSEELKLPYAHMTLQVPVSNESTFMILKSKNVELVALKIKYL